MLFFELQKEMEENPSFGAAAVKEEPEVEEIVLPKLIQVAKRIYEENWVGSRCENDELCTCT